MESSQVHAARRNLARAASRQPRGRAPRAALAVLFCGIPAAPAFAQPGVALPTLTFWGKVVLVAALIAAGIYVMHRSPPAGGQPPEDPR